MNSQTVRTVPPISYRGIQSSQSLRERGEAAAAWVRDALVTRDGGGVGGVNNFFYCT